MKSFYKIIFLSSFILMAALTAKAQNQVLQIFKNDRIVSQYNLSDIDYIEVNSTLDFPENVTATLQGENILIEWNEVLNATYDVLRSRDNSSYHVIGRDITATEFTDISPLHGANYYKVIAKIGDTSSAPSAPTQQVMFKEDETLQSGLYLGITAFNDQLTTKPIGLLNLDTKGSYELFIQNLTTKSGTILYHAVDNAIDMLQATPLPEDLSTAAVITFTDGLDMGSLMMSDTYLTKKEYLEALSRRISDENVSGVSIDSYSIGIRGDDITDISEFHANLEGLATSPDNVWEVTSMDAVNEHFQEIAEKLVQKSLSQKISLTTAGLEHGALVRFTFDEVTDAANSQLYIEGTFDLRARSLNNVIYHGLSASNGASVKGETSGVHVNYEFNDVTTDSGVLIDTQKAQEWIYIASTAKWQKNKEFTPDEHTESVVSKTSAAIILVLDCSKSLGSQFSQLQDKAISFIETLSSQTQLPESMVEGDLYESFHNTVWNVSYKGVKSGQTIAQAQQYSQEYKSTVTNTRIDGQRVVKFSPVNTGSGVDFYMLYSYDPDKKIHSFKWKFGEKCNTWNYNGTAHDIVPCLVSLDTNSSSYGIPKFTHNVVSTYNPQTRSFSASFRPDWILFVAKDNHSIAWTSWFSGLNDFTFTQK